jgi:NADPH-dependent 2,4-dienoyl-CoA reductase/sulfur reductase-like enzyme/rhodanese-related sulfurtransferase
MKVVIVGGVAGGASAAARLRRLDENAEIIIFERSGYISYANCGLPYYIGGVIKDKEELTLQTPASFWSRFRIDARVNTEVTSINRNKKTVSVHNLKTDEYYEESYDKLILSPGAIPIKPNLPGINDEGILTLRTVEDTLRIRDIVSSEDIKSAVIIGGGFIGVEVAENLKEIGIDVTIVDKQYQVLSQLDEDIVSFVHSHLKSKGVKLVLGNGVKSFESSVNDITVYLENNSSIKADIVLLAIGVTPDNRLAKEAGLELGFRNSIAVNEHMQTSDKNIYAVGDAISIKNIVTNQLSTISLAGPANKQGRIAADNIAGFESSYKGSVASSVLKVFDITVASTGINEKTAKANKINFEKIIISPTSHATYYPGGTVMTIKLLFERESERILGAQIVGFDGVDKRIDVIATAMQAGMRVTSLKDLDLSYAPPYSSAKDPVNMLGFVAENVITNKVKHFYYEDIESLLNDSNVILLDTRTDWEYDNGHAKGFDVHIPVDALRERLDELDKSKKIYVMCQSGLRSYIACRILSQNGFDCYNFAGGYRLYESISKNSFNEKSCTDCGIR